MNATQLRQAFVNLPAQSPEAPPRDTWARHAWELRKHVLHDNIDEFLTWQTLIATMVPSVEGVIGHEFEILRMSTDWPRWRGALCPILFDGNDGAMVHQAYHLMRWEKVTGRRVEELSTIDEFGGGFGAMAHLCFNLGFRGRYSIRDLPEFALLQAYYLSNVGVPLAPEAPGVSWIGRGYPTTKRDLLIACYSLSEIPAEARADPLSTPYASYLIAYQDYFNEVDNLKWFSDWAETTGEDKRSLVLPAAHPGCYYLIGEERLINGLH